MIYQTVVTQFSKALGTLLVMIDKAAVHAEARKFDMDILFQARLVPDQFSFMRQVQVACDTAKLAAARLANQEQSAPSHPDTEHTVAEIKARIQSVMSFAFL